MAKRKRGKARAAAKMRQGPDWMDPDYDEWERVPPLQVLSELAQERAVFERFLESLQLDVDRQIIRAREQGNTWAAIGDAFGIQGQTAQQLHARALRRTLAS